MGGQVDNVVMSTPYARYVGDRDPVGLLTSTLEEYRAATARLNDASWNQPWQAGKWSPRQILVHVAQWEMIFGIRLLCGVSMPGFAIQPVEQDKLMDRTGRIDGPTAFAAFEGARRMNIGVIGTLSAADRGIGIAHPEYGAITANDVIVQMAGHGIHHLAQIQSATAR
jgi:hypothetical protein